MLRVQQSVVLVYIALFGLCLSGPSFAQTPPQVNSFPMTVPPNTPTPPSPPVSPNVNGSNMPQGLANNQAAPAKPACSTYLECRDLQKKNRDAIKAKHTAERKAREDAITARKAARKAKLDAMKKDSTSPASSSADSSGGSFGSDFFSSSSGGSSNKGSSSGNSNSSSNGLH